MPAAPKTAKRPTDRKPPAKKVAAKKATPRKPKATGAQAAKNEATPELKHDLIVPLDGIDYSIDEDVFDDVELLEDLAEVQQNDAMHLLPGIMKRILGDEQWKGWKDAHRLPTGRVPAEPMADFLSEVFAALSSGNYSASPTS